MASRRPAAAQRLSSLQAVETAAWDELERAAQDKAHPWRVAVLATVRSAPRAEASGFDAPEPPAGAGADAGDVADSAEARCVIVREVDRAARALIFFADTRSAKVQQIGARPTGTLVMWSPALAWQLRLTVSLDVATSGLAVSSRWARLKMTPAATDYLSPLPPGSTLQDPHPAPERSTREHFCVVTARVRRLDWLELHAEGHRRAIFDAAGPRWVVP